MANAENTLKRLEHFGQAVWLDYTRRHLLTSAEFRRMLDEDGLWVEQLIAESTGKGGNGIVPVCDAKYDFAQLNQAQYLGDFQSLEAHGRRVIRVHLAGHDPIGAIEALRQEIVAAIGA